MEQAEKDLLKKCNDYIEKSRDQLMEINKQLFSESIKTCLNTIVNENTSKWFGEDDTVVEMYHEWQNEDDPVKRYKSFKRMIKYISKYKLPNHQIISELSALVVDDGKERVLI